METTRNYAKLKKIVGDFSNWKPYDGGLTSIGKPTDPKMKLLNKITNGKCLHCICGHRTGSLVDKKKTPKKPKNNKCKEDVICKEEFDKATAHISAYNTTTTLYEMASLIPFAYGKKYILVGKACSRYFSMTATEIRDQFNSNRKKFNTKHNPIIKRKMSLDPRIFIEKHEILSDSSYMKKYRGKTIYEINKQKYGYIYLTYISRENIRDSKTKQAINDLLLY